MRHDGEGVVLQHHGPLPRPGQGGPRKDAQRPVGTQGHRPGGHRKVPGERPPHEPPQFGRPRTVAAGGDVLAPPHEGLFNRRGLTQLDAPDGGAGAVVPAGQHEGRVPVLRSPGRAPVRAAVAEQVDEGRAGRQHVDRLGGGGPAQGLLARQPRQGPGQAPLQPLLAGAQFVELRPAGVPGLVAGRRQQQAGELPADVAQLVGQPARLLVPNVAEEAPAVLHGAGDGRLSVPQQGVVPGGVAGAEPGGQVEVGVARRRQAGEVVERLGLAGGAGKQLGDPLPHPQRVNVVRQGLVVLAPLLQDEAHVVEGLGQLEVAAGVARLGDRIARACS